MAFQLVPEQLAGGGHERSGELGERRAYRHDGEPDHDLRHAERRRHADRSFHDRVAADHQAHGSRHDQRYVLRAHTLVLLTGGAHELVVLSDDRGIFRLDGAEHEGQVGEESDQQKDSVAQAEAAVAGLIEQNPADLSYRFTLAEIYLGQKEPVKAIQAYRNIIELDQTGPLSWTVRTARLINGRIIAGTIAFISRVADPETRTYQVEAILPNQDGRIRDGMTAELSIDLPAVVAHKIPQTALTLDDDGRLGVRLAIGGEARFAEIRIISEAIDGVWVTGLPDTAEIIVVGQEFVRDGRAILPTPLDQAPSQ